MASASSSDASGYRGRIAPSPTGFLHLGHARTFWIAAERARAAGGTLVYRDEDLDRARCKPEFAQAALTDLQRLGMHWDEGPDRGGPYAPYRQSDRLHLYREYFGRLCKTGWIYPCAMSRTQIQAAALQNHVAESEAAVEDETEGDSEVVFPSALRPDSIKNYADLRNENPWRNTSEPGTINWRFRVPDGETIRFTDGLRGERAYRAGEDFGDFLVWRKDGMPAYEFAVVVDDHLMDITEVVRGADLLKSTARQLLVYAAFDWTPPDFYHCDLVRDTGGRRLAKRHDSLAIRVLLDAGRTPAEIRSGSVD